MKYRDLIESCDMILESPTIKMLDQYLFISNLKDFYLESHNYIIDNIMSLPYNFTNDICNTYFIEEEKTVDTNKGEKKKENTSSSDDGWEMNKSNWQFGYGSNTFINILKSIANFFLRIFRAIAGVFSTIFMLDNELNLVQKARNTITNSANSPAAPSAAINFANYSIRNVEGTLREITSDVYLSSEYSSYKNDMEEIINIINNKGREDYENEEDNWQPISTTEGFKSLINPAYNSYDLSTLELNPKYTNAKIRIPKEAQTNEQNYEEVELTTSLLSELANKFADDELKKITNFEKKTDNEKNDLRSEKINSFLGQNKINDFVIKVRIDYNFAGKSDELINDIKAKMRDSMRESPMTDDERAFHHEISVILTKTIKLIVGIVDSSITSLEKMCEDLNGINKAKSEKDNKKEAEAEDKFNESKNNQLITKITAASKKLFGNEGGNEGYVKLLNDISSVINLGNDINKTNSENTYNTLSNDKKFSGLSTDIFKSIFLLMSHEATFIEVLPNIDRDQLAEGFDKLRGILGF